MMGDDLERFNVPDTTYDSDNDSDGYDDDSPDEELDVYGDKPKLQFRKESSKAQWNEEFGMAEVLEKKGKMWTTTGIVRDGKLYCSIEEILFLVEIGAMDVSNYDNTPLLLSDMYTKLSEENNRYRCSWESFEVYRHLKNLGYIVGRHNIPWTLKNSKTNMNSRVECDEGSVCNIDITEAFRDLQLSETRPIFDVYSPNSKFKKSSPGNPSFVLCLIRGNPPSKQEIDDLEVHCPGSLLKFCIVEHGRVSFLSFNKVELPVLP